MTVLLLHIYLHRTFVKTFLYWQRGGLKTTEQQIMRQVILKQEFIQYYQKMSMSSVQTFKSSHLKTHIFRQFMPVSSQAMIWNDYIKMDLKNQGKIVLTRFTWFRIETNSGFYEQAWNSHLCNIILILNGISNEDCEVSFNIMLLNQKHYRYMHEIIYNKLV
jgi:hypothetical protein